MNSPCLQLLKAKTTCEVGMREVRWYYFVMWKKLEKSRVSQTVEELGVFGLACVEYFLHKGVQFLSLMQRLVVGQFEFLKELKFFAAARLIWSRGRISHRVRYLFVLLLAWAIFLTGGVFQSELTIEKSTDLNSFVKSTGSSLLIEEVTAATLKGESYILDEPIVHVVQDGETLAVIGEKYNISFESIKFANDLVANEVRPGTKLIIPVLEGARFHTVRAGDTIDSVARRYGVPSQSIVDTNYLDAPYTLTDGNVLTIPDALSPDRERYYAGRAYDTSAYGVIPYVEGSIKGSGVFVWPTSGLITQGFSAVHPAIDIANGGETASSADEGTIIRAGWWQGGYGNAVQIDHGNGYVTTYAHLNSIAVSTGQKVSKGEKIGIVGSTGRSTGPHLHFTVQLNGRYLNPLTVL